ncbi:MAG TPA: hypothetical protein VGC13_00300 [Longimicrobium sp.]|uniref:hypothetical protein n=1 Tax=Longimicrobium sp. TaxID=2029185 RepID=UPI002EDA7EE6
MDFKTATDILTQGPSVTLARIAERFGVQLATIARARIETENRRSPPPRWEPTLAEMAEDHACELEQRILALRRFAAELKNTS